jgi:hypothetical protein
MFTLLKAISVEMKQIELIRHDSILSKMLFKYIIYIKVMKGNEFLIWIQINCTMYNTMATTVCEMYGCQTSCVNRIAMYFIAYFSGQ